MSNFGIRSVFVHGGSLYEERIVLIAAENEDAALVLAEEEAQRYCEDLTDCKPTGFYQSFAIYDEEVGPGLEIFSLMRESDLTTAEYLDRFFDTGNEYERHSSE